MGRKRTRWRDISGPIRRYFRRPWCIVPYTLPVTIGGMEFKGGQVVHGGPTWRFWTRHRAIEEAQCLNAIASHGKLVTYRVERVSDA